MNISYTERTTIFPKKMFTNKVYSEEKFVLYLNSLTFIKMNVSYLVRPSMIEWMIPLFHALPTPIYFIINSTISAFNYVYLEDMVGCTY